MTQSTHAGADDNGTSPCDNENQWIALSLLALQVVRNSDSGDTSAASPEGASSGVSRVTSSSKLYTKTTSSAMSAVFNDAPSHGARVPVPRCQKPTKKSPSPAKRKADEMLLSTSVKQTAPISPLPTGLNPSFWVIRNRHEVCTFGGCRFAARPGNLSQRRHFHPRCGHIHKSGVNKGLKFATSQLDKAVKHQKLHPEFAPPRLASAQS